MDIKTVVLAIPFSIVRHIANKALPEVTARWPALQKSFHGHALRKTAC
jgi:hypothetical protein